MATQLTMTLQERITQLEGELQQCQAQLQQWTEARLRTEGALFVLRKVKEEEDATNSTTNPTATNDGV
jgi:hypothetical protein